MIPLSWKWARRIAQSALSLLLPATAAFAAERIPWTTSRVVGSPEPPSLARVERVFPGLTFRQPLDVQYEPRGKRWWVAQETGQLLSFPDQDDPKAADPVLDLREFSKSFNQLLGFTFDPDFGHARGTAGRADGTGSRRPPHVPRATPLTPPLGCTA